ncbi:hypothetical protein F2Q68_00011330 [Brassica cretica]|uniref:Uncharacterized protein n=1 Tax=Brassica cretica TaxID=69181 RepID=A0A8S9L1D1_BRACR|nr:hypothetical protein F2Q68_00011330 [Brassica cretica]
MFRQIRLSAELASVQLTEFCVRRSRLLLRRWTAGFCLWVAVASSVLLRRLLSLRHAPLVLTAALTGVIPVSFDHRFCSSPLQSTLLPRFRCSMLFCFNRFDSRWFEFVVSRLELHQRRKILWLVRLWVDLTLKFQAPSVLLSLSVRFFERDPVPVDLPIKPLPESFCWLKIGDSHGGNVSRPRQMLTRGDRVGRVLP